MTRFHNETKAKQAAENHTGKVPTPAARAVFKVEAQEILASLIKFLMQG